MRADPTAGAVPGLDLDALVGWLGGLGAASGPLQVRRIGDGQSNITCLVTDAQGRRVVLRRPPLGDRLGSAHDVAREARIIDALAGTTVPAPRILGVRDEGGTDGAPVVAMTFIDGVPVGPDTLERLTPAARRGLGPAIVHTLATLHSVDVDAVGLTGLARRSSYASRQLRRWSGQWDASRTREHHGVDALTERLRATVPEETEVRLVHGDLHPANTLVDVVTGDMVAALDWELCTLGDPLADLGTVLAYWPDEGEEALLPFSVSAAPGFARRAELVAEYGRLTGRDLSTVGFWHALGLWKVAIICEGIIQRVAGDTRNAAGWTPHQRTVDTLIDLATRVADDAGL